MRSPSWLLMATKKSHECGRIGTSGCTFRRPAGHTNPAATATPMINPWARARRKQNRPTFCPRPQTHTKKRQHTKQVRPDRRIGIRMHVRASGGASPPGRHSRRNDQRPGTCTGETKTGRSPSPGRKPTKHTTRVRLDRRIRAHVPVRLPRSTFHGARNKTKNRRHKTKPQKTNCPTEMIVLQIWRLAPPCSTPTGKADT